MKSRPDILARQHLHVLEAFASSNTLIAFDYDGALAPIASTPEQARMRMHTRRLLTQVAERYPTVVISGRALEDLTRRLAAIPLRHIVGNFGHEPADHDAPPQVAQWAQLLNERLATETGIVIENKRFSLAIHYRHARDKQRALAEITQAMRGLRGGRVLNGTQAVTLMPQRGPNKGTSLQRTRKLLACDAAVYVGDDDTDEDAFASDRPDRLLSIRVGPTAHTQARFRLDKQSDIDRLLRSLLAIKRTHSS